MGWREMMAWNRAFRRQVEGTRSSPDSWDGTEQDAGWADLRAQRDRTRGK